ncbi:MAG: ubiquinone biosynthesis protein UbiB [Xanthobacteraceae bacterium]|nr:ubiquinone biosynthesis protein UbiB [Xanthobacteraceae bacterium]
MLSPSVGPRDALTIARIVRVNHAGEYGAIRIYRAQIRISRWLFPDIVDDLEDILAHEIRHCAVFLDAMPARHSRPCRVMAFWSLGGSVLGACTALMGRQALWACTAAVEAAVHRHLEDQLGFLAGRDQALHAAILDIREEELSHLNHAEAQLAAPNLFRRLLRNVISVLTDMLIWLSTWGDSARMAADLRRRATG